MFTNLYLKLAVLGVIVALFGAENLWIYNKGKDSVFQGVIAGTETYQKKEEARATQDIVRSNTDTQTIAKLVAERDTLKRKLAYVPTTPAPADCQLSPEQLSGLQTAVGQAK